MRKNGQVSDRPEELLAYEIVKTHLKCITNIDKQKVVWFNDINHAKLDVEFAIRSGQRYALRLMGPPHEPKKAQRHDTMQEIYLQERGYIVIDFWYDKMPFLWLRNKKTLDVSELHQAFIEIKYKLKCYGLFLEKFDSSLITQ